MRTDLHSVNLDFSTAFSGPCYTTATPCAPEFKKLLIETGVADYWRQTGKWGDGCKPVGADDFQCQ